MSNPSFALDPFYLSDFSDTDSDDSTVEPIDEQEIYGKMFPWCLNIFLVTSPLPYHAETLEVMITRDARSRVSRDPVEQLQLSLD